MKKAELSKKEEQSEQTKPSKESEPYLMYLAGLVIAGGLGYLVYMYKNNETNQPPIQNITEQKQVIYPKHFEME